MGKNIRRQLTLFLDEGDAGNIEKIRADFNPRQSALIKSHVTLCREDEIENLGKVMGNLANLQYAPIAIDFGPPKRFAEGKGVLMPATGSLRAFDALRKGILLGTTDDPKKHEPHITLVHPRNSTCTDAVFREIARMDLPGRLTFRKISLIEQEDDRPWRVLGEFHLL